MNREILTISVLIGVIFIGSIGYAIGKNSQHPGDLVLEKLFENEEFQKRLAGHNPQIQQEPYTNVNWQPYIIDDSVTALKCITENSSYGFGLVTDLGKIRNPQKWPDNLLGDTLIYDLKTNPKLQYIEGGVIYEFSDIGSNNPNIKNYFHKGRDSYILMTLYKPYGVVSVTFHDEITGMLGDKDFTIESSIYSCKPN